MVGHQRGRCTASYVIRLASGGVIYLRCEINVYRADALTGFPGVPPAQGMAAVVSRLRHSLGIGEADDLFAARCLNQRGVGPVSF